MVYKIIGEIIKAAIIANPGVVKGVLNCFKNKKLDRNFVKLLPKK